MELPLQMQAYKPSEEAVVPHVKMMFRTDVWDQEHFPHVMPQPA